MANNQEFNSIDDLFRKSFNDLPASPSASGWDQPSDRVWQNIHTEIQPKQVGWFSAGKLVTMAAVSAMVIIGAYYYMRADTSPAQQPIDAPVHTAPAVSSESPAATNADNTDTKMTQESKDDKPIKPKSIKPNTAQQATTSPDISNPSEPKNTLEQSGTKSKVPNSVEKRRLEEAAKKAAQENGSN